MPAVQPFGFSVAILAAGRSLRMGQPKMLLRWEGTTVVGHLITTWKALGARQIAVVHAADDDAMPGELERLEFPKQERIANSDVSRGMFSSVQCAAEWKGWTEATTHWIIVLGDQPHLRRETLTALIEFARRNPEKICQPGRGAHGLHPVVLPRKYFGKLAEARTGTLKEFLQLMAGEVAMMETEDAGADLDIDLPADYERAKQLSATKL